MSTLYYLENFNNYYNRTIKKASDRSLSPFMEFVLKVDTDFSFNPNDHVTTTIVVNYTYRENGIEYEISDDRNIDYILVSEDDETVKSKWFVTDRIRTLGGQWSLSLRRDLIADYIEGIKESPIFVEKGYISNRQNTLIYNNENITVSQIKKKEILLQDKTKTPWIVGYMSREYYKGLSGPADDESSGIYYSKSNYKAKRTVSDRASYAELSTIGGQYGFIESDATNDQNLVFGVSYNGGGVRASQKDGAIEQNSFTYYNLYCKQTGSVGALSGLAYSMMLANVVMPNAPQFKYDVTKLGDYTEGRNVPYIADISRLRSLNGKLLENEDQTGPRYFTFIIKENGPTTMTIKPPVGSNMYNEIKGFISSQIQNAAYNPNMPNFNTAFEWRDSETNAIELQIPVMAYSVSVSTSTAEVDTRVDLAKKELGIITTKRDLVDAPYVMFCAPYYDKSIDTGNTSFLSEGAVNLAAITSLVTDLGSHAYDLQLLPYCPLELQMYGDEIDISELPEDSFALINYNNGSGVYPDTNACGIMFFAETSSFRGEVIVEEGITMPGDTLEIKVKNETEFCRIVSPNYASAFEFNPMKNGGMKRFEINCTYKPYQPYIHVNPFFDPGYLYGGDFNDNRGLICAGDFSLPQVSSAWENYKIQNKSYMESFNRQIENMEVNNAVQREREIWGVIGGTASGAAGGALAGSYIGRGPGDLIGGTVGGVASLAGGIRDVQLADKLRAEAIDYTKDQFGYSLENIRALPTTISRVSSYDIDNKYFPFVEIYGCSSYEEQAFRDKIIYNGMTVMAVGRLESYIRQGDISYFKGKLIRFNGDAESHEVVEIANELNKGVFI